MTFYATVIVENDDALDRVVGEYGDEWRGQFYPFHTEEEVVEHFVYNAVVNGVHDVRRLDGWADMEEDAVNVEIDASDFVTEEIA